MERTSAEQLESLFLSLSDRTRFKLLGLMANGEVSVGYLADTLGESQPKISRHLAYLRTAGLVSTRRDGKWIYYGIDMPTDVTAANVLTAALGASSQESVPLGASPQPTYEEVYAEPAHYEDEYVDDGWRPAELEIHLL
jgi:ArsR family transcriptional regulator